MKKALLQLKSSHEQKLASCIRVATISDKIGDTETYRHLIKKASGHKRMIDAYNQQLLN